FAGKWLPEIFAPMTTPRQLPANAGAPSPFLENQFGLKQFPDAKDPKKACYQAIIRSSCKFDSANDTGLLYDPLSGDPSGGLSIRIYDSEPIVEKLGILAAREPGQEFATVKPFFPFWWNLNVSYGSAENLCWRTSTKWSVPKKDGGHNGLQQAFVALAA